MLALISGQGRLPEILAQGLAKLGRPHRLCALQGFRPDGWSGAEVDEFRLEHLGAFFDRLHLAGVTEVSFAGAVRRPEVDAAAVDAATLPLLARIEAALPQGDDATLRAFIALFEEQGFAVRGVDEIDPKLIPPTGCLSTRQPTHHDISDARRGVAIVAAMGQADVGQACVVSGGLALAVEAIGGTDWMLRSLMAHPDELPHDTSPGTFALDVVKQMLDMPPDTRPRRNPMLPSGGILVKGPKPGQDRRFDLPTIGPDTLMLAAECGLDGVVVEAGGIIMLKPEQCIDIANLAGMLLWVRQGETGA